MVPSFGIFYSEIQKLEVKIRTYIIEQNIQIWTLFN